MPLTFAFDNTQFKHSHTHTHTSGNFPKVAQAKLEMKNYIMQVLLEQNDSGVIARKFPAGKRLPFEFHKLKPSNAEKHQKFFNYFKTKQLMRAYDDAVEAAEKFVKGKNVRMDDSYRKFVTNSRTRKHPICLLSMVLKIGETLESSPYEGDDENIKDAYHDFREQLFIYFSGAMKDGDSDMALCMQNELVRGAKSRGVKGRAVPYENKRGGEIESRSNLHRAQVKEIRERQKQKDHPEDYQTKDEEVTKISCHCNYNLQSSYPLSNSVFLINARRGPSRIRTRTQQAPKGPLSMLCKNVAVNNDLRSSRKSQGRIQRQESSTPPRSFGSGLTSTSATKKMESGYPTNACTISLGNKSMQDACRRSKTSTGKGGKPSLTMSCIGQKILRSSTSLRLRKRSTTNLRISSWELTESNVKKVDNTLCVEKKQRTFWHGTIW